MFSILAPGKHIPPHDGPYKGVLRYHLGLVVPDAPVERLGIRVGGRDAGAGPRAGAWCSTTPTSTRPGTTPTRRASCSSSTSCARCAEPMRTVNAAVIKAHRVLAVHPGRQASPPRVGGASSRRPRTEPRLTSGPPGERATVPLRDPTHRSSSPSRARLALGVVTASPAVRRRSRKPSRSPPPRSRRPPTGYDVEVGGAVERGHGQGLRRHRSHRRRHRRPGRFGEEHRAPSQVTGLAAAPRWYFELVPAKGGSLVTADHSLHLASAPEPPRHRRLPHP